MLPRRELMLVVFLVACGKGGKPAAPTTAPPPPGGMPALAAGEAPANTGGAHGAPPANPHHQMGMAPGAQMPAQMPPPGHGEPATPGGIEFDEKSVLAGELKLVDATKDKVKAGDTIFVVVRRAPESENAPPGAILAVKKLEAAATFPQKFVVDGRDAMMAGTDLRGKVVISVRVDKDQNATTKNPGDVVGQVTTSPPQTALTILLDKVL